MTDLGLGAEVRVWTDSNADKAIASRRGLVKTRHMELKFLCLARSVQLGSIQYFDIE